MDAMSAVEDQALRREGRERRDEQRLAFHRNQAVGLLVLAGAVLVYRLLHTPPGWILPAGWWRLW
jgi:hypothetical protein